MPLTGWLIRDRNVFLTVPEAGSWRSGCHPGRVLFWLADFSSCPHLVEGAERGSKLSRDSHKGTNPVHKGSILMASSNPNYLPQALCPNTMSLGIGFQHMDLGRNGHSVCTMVGYPAALPLLLPCTQGPLPLQRPDSHFPSFTASKAQAWDSPWPKVLREIS